MKTKLKNLPRTFLRREVPKSQKTYCLKASAVKLNPYGEVTLFKKPKHLKVATFGEKFFKNQPRVQKIQFHEHFYASVTQLKAGKNIISMESQVILVLKS